MTMLCARFLSCTRGAAAAEMALILPLSMLLLFTGLEAGHYFYQEHQVIKGLRDGARYAARQSFDDINCRGGAPSGIPGGIETNIKNLVRTGQLATGGSPRVTGWDANEVTITVTCPTIAESQTGLYDATERAPQVNIATTFGYNSLFNGLGVISDSASLNASHQATVMGI